MICPVCGKEIQGFIHIAKKKDYQHQEFIKGLQKIVDPMLPKMYLFEIIEELNKDLTLKGLVSKSFLTKRRKELGISGRKVVAIKRTGKSNPIKKRKVREREKIKIAKTIKKLWGSEEYDQRISGMLGKFGKESSQWKSENHTPLFLAEKEYVDLLSQYQDVTICSKCASTTRKINVHHIDENHGNFLISNLEPLCVSCHSKYHYSHSKKPFILIGKKFTFAAAHKLPRHGGKCKNLHGHEWTLEICIRKRVDSETGMVLDFSDLKKVVNTYVINKLDHGYLNKIIKNPTAENILIWVWSVLMFKALLKGIEKISVWESSDSVATITKEEMLSFFKSNIEEYVSKEWFTYRRKKRKYKE